MKTIKRWWTFYSTLSGGTSYKSVLATLYVSTLLGINIKNLIKNVIFRFFIICKWLCQGKVKDWDLLLYFLQANNEGGYWSHAHPCCQPVDQIRNFAETEKAVAVDPKHSNKSKYQIQQQQHRSDGRSDNNTRHNLRSSDNTKIDDLRWPVMRNR